MLASLLLSLSLHAANCPMPRIILVPEFHNHETAPIWANLVTEAERGECLTVFEGFTRVDGRNSKRKAKVLAPFGPSKNGYANVFGMDSNELKGMAISGELYLRARDEHRETVLEDMLHEMVLEPGMIERLRRHVPLRRFKNLIEPLPEPRFRVRYDKLTTSERNAFLLQTYLAFQTMVRQTGLDAEMVDLENYPNSGQPDLDAERFADAMMPARDAYMAESLHEIACANHLGKPIKASLGEYHVPGLVRELQLIWPGIEPGISR